MSGRWRQDNIVRRSHGELQVRTGRFVAPESLRWALNPILTDTAAGRGGWYWIEIMRYSDAAKSAKLIVSATTSQLPLNLDVYVVYRITALAIGRRPGTTVVLQQTYARQRMKD